MKKKMTVKRARVWDRTTYETAVAELSKSQVSNRLNKTKCPTVWVLDKHGRLTRKEWPFQVLLAHEPIPNPRGEGFLPGLELGLANRVHKVHTELLHAGTYKVHQHLTKTMNYFVSRRAVGQTLVNQCSICMRRQPQRVATPAVPVRAFWPMQRVQLDFIDSRGMHLFYPRKMQPGNWDNGTKSRTEYKVDYILIAVCVFSGFAWFRPLFNNCKWEVCQEITKLFNEFGWPQIVHTDNGSPFDSRMLVSLCREHDAFLVHGRPYHPQSQGKVERLIRTLKNSVQKIQEEDKQQQMPEQPWLQYLSRAVFVYNRTPHSKTGVPPFVAFYGRKPLEGLNFRGEWEMVEVERESSRMVLTRRTYHACQEEEDGCSDTDTLVQYVQQLAVPSVQDAADRDALFRFLIEQQPRMLAEVQGLQNHRNSEMVRRSIRMQGELKPVHIGDRVVFCKMSGIALGMKSNPAQYLLVGNVIDEHVGGIMLSYSIQEDDKTIHRRVPRENIGIRIPGYNISEDMNLCAIRNITAQATTFALRLGQTIGIETPESCVDAQPGMRNTTFAQVPYRDPVPTPATAVEAQDKRRRIAAVEDDSDEPVTILVRPILKTRSTQRQRFQHEAAGRATPQAEVALCRRKRS